MAAEDRYAAGLIALDANPSVVISPPEGGSRMRVKSGTVAVAGADSIASTYRFVRMRSGDYLYSIKCYHDSITGHADANVGLYSTVTDGAAVVDDNLYSDAITLAVEVPSTPHVTATAPFLECRIGTSALGGRPQDIGNAIWEDLGLSADPLLQYDLAITTVSVGTIVGDITLVVEYVAA